MAQVHVTKTHYEDDNDDDNDDLDRAQVAASDSIVIVGRETARDLTNKGADIGCPKSWGAS